MSTANNRHHDSTASSSTSAPDALYRSVQSTDEADAVSVPPHKSLLSTTAACLAIFKGNIGPGILNLPKAFALVGYGMGSLLFAAIAAQGIYSMWLLVECQRYCRNNGRQHHHLTFMAVAQDSLGKRGGRLVEILLFILQGGVCCVFLSLISTNLHAALPAVSNIHAILLVSVYMMAAASLKDISDLLYLNLTANTFMVLAIATAIVAGLSAAASSEHHATFAKSPDISHMIFFTSDLFFAFEGIGLVLPIENAYDHTRNTNSFSFILLSSMAIVALAFGLTGVSGSMGFNVKTGSITAFLHEEYPNVLWYSIVNVLVIVAVALTFPLQLAPAAQVLEGWVQKTSTRNDDLDASEGSVVPMNAPSSNEGNKTSEQPQPSFPTATEEVVQAPTDYSWLYQRWGLVVIFTLIVLTVDDLSLLMGLFGAVGQTGLAGMPCAIHLALQYQGRAPRCIWMSVLDVLILLLTSIVMVAGCIVSIRQIVMEH